MMVGFFVAFLAFLPVQLLAITEVSNSNHETDQFQGSGSFPTCDEDLTFCQNEGQCREEINDETHQISRYCSCKNPFEFYHTDEENRQCQHRYNDCKGRCSHGGCIEGTRQAYSVPSFSCKDCESGYKLGSEQQSCVQRNLCDEEDPCREGAECHHLPIPTNWKNCKCGQLVDDDAGNPSYVCPYGYVGQFCQSEKDFCQARPCKNGAKCRSFAGKLDFVGFKCECGVFGVFLDTKVNWVGGTCEEAPTVLTDVPIVIVINNLDTEPSSNLLRPTLEQQLKTSLTDNPEFDSIQDYSQLYNSARKQLTVTIKTRFAKNLSYAHNTTRTNSRKRRGGPHTPGPEPEGVTPTLPTPVATPAPIRIQLGLLLQNLQKTIQKAVASTTKKIQQQIVTIPAVQKAAGTGGVTATASAAAVPALKASVDSCVSFPCDHGGRCTSQLASIASKADRTCVCKSGYEGKSCETDINECAVDPCKNGAKCNDLVNDYSCDCSTCASPAWSGKHCDVDKFCSATDCGNNPISGNAPTGECVAGTGKCNCFTTADRTYIGIHCDEVNFCETKTGPVSCGPGKCTTSRTGYTCDCPLDTTGKHCEKPVCGSLTCKNGGHTCTPVKGAPHCTCPGTNWSGPTCEVSHCASPTACNGEPCGVSGGAGNYSCTCGNNYSGFDCENIICQNGGNTTASGTCSCHTGFDGQFCEQNENERVEWCFNGGHWNDTEGKCYCGKTKLNCFEGKQCETYLRPSNVQCSSTMVNISLTAIIIMLTGLFA